MSETQSALFGIAERYALALFELTQEDADLDALVRDIETLEQALNDSAEFSDFIGSPILSRDQKRDVMHAFCQKAGVGLLMANSLALMAMRNRLFILPVFLKTLCKLIENEKGEVTAEVMSAVALSKTHMTTLAQTLRDIVGKTVKININIDEKIIGGLIVRLDSYMVDNSIRTKLLKLQNLMKEVG